MSSDMFPFATHPEYHAAYDIEQFASRFASLGAMSKKYNQTLTFHPCQYNQLTSLSDDVVQKAIVDINFHATVMDMMGLPDQSIIIIHGGSKQGGKEAALERFRRNFKRLSPNAQRRLCLENCEMAYAVEDLLHLSDELDIPIVVDFHHHALNPGTSGTSIEALATRAFAVWKRRGMLPIVHVSQSRDGVQEDDAITVRRAHSEYITRLPRELLVISQTERVLVDLECKAKELALIRLRRYYEAEKGTDIIKIKS